jgi:opacity protein-like surface antigen
MIAGRHPLRSLAFLALPLAAITTSSAAWAQGQGGSCPPGSWFCGDAQAAGSTSQGATVQGQAQTPAQAPPVVVTQQPPPPVVVYQPPPPVVVYQAPRDTPPPYEYTPRDPDYFRKREWGLNLHLEGAMFGKGRFADSGMGGLGLGLRYKPSPYVGIQADVDFFGGRDYNGYRRGETAFALNALVFVNPRSKTQLYFLAGIGWSIAKATEDRSGYDDIVHRYSYFGGQVGIGVEFRLSKTVALNMDVRGFVRGRTDNNTRIDPEFRDAMGRTTNTSGGGLLTGGLTFYF